MAASCTISYQQCFCHKLLTKAYSTITADEAALLQQALKSAPELFKPVAEQRNANDHNIEGNNEDEAYDNDDKIKEDVDKLVRTYPRAGIDNVALHPLLSDYEDIVVRIYHIVQKSDSWKRIACFVLAKLHQTSTSIDYIVKRVHNSFPGNIDTIKSQIIKMLWIGRQWHAVVKTLESICGSSLPSVMYIVNYPSIWEKASPRARYIALASLHSQTDFYTKARAYTPVVHKMLAKVGRQNGFVNTGVDFTTKSSKHHYTTSATIPAAISPIYPLTASATTITMQIVPGITTEAAVLLVLLCFLDCSRIPLYVNVLKRAILPRQSWARNGHLIIDRGAFDDLPQIASAESVLDACLTELSTVGACSLESENGGLVILDARISEHISIAANNIDANTIRSWRCLALVIACRAIPIKYIQPVAIEKERNYLMSQLKHAIQAVRINNEFHCLSPPVKAEIALGLVEASRFPRLAWKRLVISWAREIMGDIRNDYVESSITQREVLICRLAGQIPEAFQAIQSLLSQHTLVPSSNTDEQRLLHASIGHAVIECALNHFQEEHLVAAITILDTWKPLSQPHSPAELVVEFRSNLLRAKILRYQGRFTHALEYSHQCKEIASQCGGLIFEDDLATLVCETADILRELERLPEAESVLIERMALHLSQSERTLLSLCLAEVRFAQNRVDEGQALCNAIKSTSLNKMARLRLYITMAKLCHVSSCWEDALNWWTRASQTMAEFPPTSGHATRAIHISIADVLQQQDILEIAEKTRTAIAHLDKLLEHAEAKCWIAGLQHWCHYLGKRT